MSLDYDLTDVKDRGRNFPPDEYGLLNGIVHNMIWVSIPVGIDRITEANADEFYDRIVLFQEAYDRPGEWVTREQVHQLVGLRTNVGTKSREEFERSLRKVGLMYDDLIEVNRHLLMAAMVLSPNGTAQRGFSDLSNAPGSHLMNTKRLLGAMLDGISYRNWPEG